MKEKKKRVTKVTPIGEAKWTFVREPQKGFRDGDKDKYRITLLFDPSDPEWKTWASDLKSRSDSKGHANLPMKKEVDKDTEEPTGKIAVKFHTGAEYPPKVFNKDNRDDTDQDYLIGNGSKVQVSYNEGEYDAFGGGFTLYFGAVKVHELVEFEGTGGTAAGYGFDGPVAAGAVEADEDIPF